MTTHNPFKREIYAGGAHGTTRDTPLRQNGNQSTLCGDQSNMSVKETRLWCTYETKRLIREHKRPDLGESDNDVLRRLALAVEPESPRAQALQELQEAR